jgi:anti-sigma B factor antagonist
MNNPLRAGEDSIDPLPVPEIPLRIDIEQPKPHTAVLRLHGDLDMRTARLLRDELSPRLEQQGHTVVVDLTGLEFLGSAGLSELVGSNEAATDRGVTLLLVATSRTVLRPLEITGLGSLFRTFPSTAAALTQV